jgi:hypothetical protein
MSEKETPISVVEPTTGLAPTLKQMYRTDLLRIAAALGGRPRSDHYRDESELIALIIAWANRCRLKDDWLLRVDVPWTMYQYLPCLDELKYKSYEKLSVESLREICRQYSIVGFTKLTTKAELAKKAKALVEDSKVYPHKIYRSRITKMPIPEEELIFKQQKR